MAGSAGRRRGAQAQRDRHQHQPGAMGRGHDERPPGELRRRNPRQDPRMAAIDELVDAEQQHQHAGADADGLAVLQELAEQRKRQHRGRHREQMARAQGRERREHRRITPGRHAVGHGQRPAHRRVQAVVDAEGDHREPQRRLAVADHADG